MVLASPPNVPLAGRDVVGEDPVAALARALGLGVGDEVLGLGGKADDEARPAVPGGAQTREDVGILDQVQRRRRALLLQLLRRLLDAPVGHRRGADRDIGRQRRLAGRQHLARGRRPARP